MTLTITELSQHGIAMVADTAVTETSNSGTQPITRVLDGAKKLQYVPYLRAGISAWGVGSLHIENREIATDIWLIHFIRSHSSLIDINDFAESLKDELQNIAGHIQTPMGFHLAGYTDVEGSPLPTFYHIRNNDGPFGNLTQHEFIVGHDSPPREFPAGESKITRNGHYGPYTVINDNLENALTEIQRNPNLGITIPYPSLDGRLSYHAACIRFISDLYASSRLDRIIGTGVTTLGIYPTGEVFFRTT